MTSDAAAHAAYVGPISGRPCGNTKPLPHYCHTAASDAKDKHDGSEPYGQDKQR